MFFEKINDTDKLLAKPMQIGRRHSWRKLERNKEIAQKRPIKFRGSLENILKTYIVIHWKIYKQWKNIRYMWLILVDLRRYQHLQMIYNNKIEALIKSFPTKDPDIG
jgi:hypothetical protein